METFSIQQHNVWFSRTSQQSLNRFDDWERITKIWSLIRYMHPLRSQWKPRSWSEVEFSPTTLTWTGSSLFLLSLHMPKSYRCKLFYFSSSEPYHGANHKTGHRDVWQCWLHAMLYNSRKCGWQDRGKCSNWVVRIRLDIRLKILFSFGICSLTISEQSDESGFSRTSRNAWTSMDKSIRVLRWAGRLFNERSKEPTSCTWFRFWRLWSSTYLSRFCIIHWRRGL